MFFYQVSSNCKNVCIHGVSFYIYMSLNILKLQERVRSESVPCSDRVASPEGDSDPQPHNCCFNYSRQGAFHDPLPAMLELCFTIYGRTTFIMGTRPQVNDYLETRIFF